MLYIYIDILVNDVLLICLNVKSDVLYLINKDKAKHLAYCTGKPCLGKKC
jgi:hypothetical protein